MKKTLSLMAIFVAVSNAFAGGLLTNTNQNAAFVRNFAQEGKIDLTSIYANPAGGAFLSNGWHLSLNSQTAFQERNIETTFRLFETNADDPNRTHRFEGKAKAPVIPSFIVSYNRDKWSVSAHFAIGGGGGKCEFDKGLGSFEAIGAAIPPSVTEGLVGNGVPASMGPDRYTMNSSMKGRSYYFGLQLGGTYKFLDNLAGFVGLRGVYASCSYSGFVGDLTLINSATGLETLPAVLPAPFGGMPYIDLVRMNYGDVDPTITLNCDQTGFGVTPIIGVDWKINKQWNVSAKYEFCTKINLKNSSQMSAMAATLAETEQGQALAQFKDGEKVRDDVPAILALGVQYSPLESVRLSAGYHQFFDKATKKFNNKQKLIDHNTHEFLIGAEYDACKLITVSASWEITRYGLADEFMNDLSFNLSNHMLGAGVRINATKRCSIDLGYMYTFYNSRDVVTQTAAGLKTDHYDRKNQTFGIGVNLHI